MNQGEVLVSVELICRDDPSLFEVIQTVMNQTMADLELIVVDSSANRVPRVAHEARVRLISADCSMLNARILAHKSSCGRYSLILDATRKLRPDCLKECLALADRFDMLVVPEGSIGNGFVPELFRADRRVTGSASRNPRNLVPTSGAIMPRFFRRELLDSAISALERNLTEATRNQVNDGDHQLLYYEAWKDSHRVGVCSGVLIDHIEDVSLLKVWRKYRRYGASRRVLRGHTEYGKLLSERIGVRIRSRSAPHDRLKSILLFAMKFVPFAVGYCLG